MRIILSVGYNRLLLGKNNNDIGHIISALQDAMIVNEKYESGLGTIYVPSEDDTKIDLSVIGDDSIRLPAEGSKAASITDKLIEISKENNELKSKIYSLKNKLEKYESIKDENE